MILIIGIVAIILGGYLRYWINKNRFDRRNPSGLQQFTSYNKSLAITGFERVVKTIGMLLVLVGLLFVVTYFYNKRTAEKFRKQNTEQK